MKNQLRYNSYFDLPITKYYQLLDEMRNAENDYDKSYIIVKYLYDVTNSDLSKISISEFKEMFENTPDPQENHTKFKISKKITIGDKVFDISTDLTKFNIAQYIDFQMSLSKVDLNPEYILSTILVPHKMKYNDGYEANEHIEWIRNNVSIGISNQLIDFFIKRYLTSINNIIRSSEIMYKMKKMMMLDTNKRKMCAETIKAHKEVRKAIQSILGTV